MNWSEIVTNQPGTRIDMAGMLNLRDIGGWVTADGGTVVRGRIYRSDRLSSLTADDHVKLDDLGIRTVIDLRFEFEVSEDPSLLWSTVTDHHHIPIAGELAQQKSFLDRAFGGELSDLTDASVGDSYIEMLERYSTEFGRAVTSAISGSPSLYHCTAGKDRTGLTTMLLLATAGVSDDDILTDFTLSNTYRADLVWQS
jgi:protein-tyrosine phosphatase